MAIKYFYPTSEQYTSKVYDQDGATSSLYSRVDEGIATANDADYIYFSGVSNPSGSIKFLYNENININATTATIKTRARTLGASSSGEIIFQLTEERPGIIGFATHTKPSTIILDSTWRDYTATYNNISINNPLYNKLNLQYIAKTGDENHVPAISSVEIILSGESICNYNSLSIPGNVNLSNDTLKKYDITDGWLSGFNGINELGLLYSSDAKSLNPKSSTFIPSGIFDRAYFDISGQPDVNNYIYPQYGNYSGLCNNIAFYKDLYKSNNELGEYSSNDNFIAISGQTILASNISINAYKNSGDFSIYCRYINNHSYIGPNLTSYVLYNQPVGTEWPDLMVMTQGDYQSSTNLIAYLRTGATFSYESLSVPILDPERCNGYIVTYSSGNGLGLYTCHTDGYISSGTYTSPFTRFNINSNPFLQGSPTLLFGWPYSGLIGFSEIGFANYDIKEKIDELRECYYKTSDRLSSNTSTTPSGSDYHIIHKIKHFNDPSYKDVPIFGYPVVASGIDKTFYDIAHSGPLPSYLTPDDYVFSHADDSGCVTWNMWYSLDTNSTNEFSAIANLDAYADNDKNQPYFRWIGNRIPLYSGGIRKATASGYFVSKRCEPMVAGKTLDKSLFYSTIRVPSGNFFTTFKVYSSSLDIVGWSSPPTGTTNNTPLYICGNLQTYSGTTLFTKGGLSNSGNIPLYVQGSISVNSGTTLYMYSDVNRNLPLYISGPTVYSGNKSTTLFIRTQYGQSGVPTSGTTLFIRNFVENSGNFPLVITGPDTQGVSGNLPLFLQNTIYSGVNQIPLVIRTQYSESGRPSTSNTLFLKSIAEQSGNTPLYIGGPSIDNVNRTAPLYISGPVLNSLNNIAGLKPVSLFIGNYFGSGNKALQLSISNRQDSSGIYTLHTIGGGTDARNNNVPLFISNYSSNSGNIPLYIPGGINEAFVNLSVAGKNIDATSGNTTLFINATSDSGLTKFATMYLEGNGHSQYAPLFMKADTTGENFDNITLYLNNDNTSSKNTTLFIKNLGGTSNSGTRLFVKGDGVNNNFYAVNGSMSMFINRGNDSISNSVNLFLESVKPKSGETTLFIDGTRGTNSGTTLAIPNVASPKTNNTSMYTHGY